MATQGDTTLKTPYLFVKYEGKAAPACPSAAPDGPRGQGSTRVTFLWASNGVEVIAGTDRRITSDLADFDAKADTALFVGNVLINQDKNVLDGGRLFVDRKAGKSRLETPAEGGQPAGRITATFYQSEAKAGAPPKAKVGRREPRRAGACSDRSSRTPTRPWTSRPTPSTSTTQASGPSSTATSGRSRATW